MVIRQGAPSVTLELQLAVRSTPVKLDRKLPRYGESMDSVAVVAPVQFRLACCSLFSSPPRILRMQPAVCCPSVGAPFTR
jgi:hypothetical protein